MTEFAVALLGTRSTREKIVITSSERPVKILLA